MPLQGKRELLLRLEGIRGVEKPIAKNWAGATTRSAKRRVPVKTGRLRQSIRARFTSKGPLVIGAYWGNFINAGTVSHAEKPKRRRGKTAALRYGGPGGQPIFRRRVRHPATRARPFKRAAALDGLREHPMAGELVRIWNESA